MNPEENPNRRDNAVYGNPAASDGTLKKEKRTRREELARFAAETVIIYTHSAYPSARAHALHCFEWADAFIAASEEGAK